MPNLNTFLSEVGAKGYQKPNWFEFRMMNLPDGLSLKLKEGEIKSFAKFLEEGFVCTSVSLPGRSFSTVEQTIYGFERMTPTKGMYNPLQCTFLTPISPSGRNMALEFFQRWQNWIQDTEQSRMGDNSVNLNRARAFDLQFPNNIYAEAEILQYSFIDLVENKSKFQLNVDVDLGRFGSFDLDKALGFGKDRDIGGDTNRQVSLRHRYVELYPITVGETRLDWGATSEYSQLDVTFNYSYWVDMATGVDVKDNIFGYPEKSFEEKFWNKAKNIAIGQAIRNNWIK
jgi:hypothetical protein